MTKSTFANWPWARALAPITRTDGILITRPTSARHLSIKVATETKTTSKLETNASRSAMAKKARPFWTRHFWLVITLLLVFHNFLYSFTSNFLFNSKRTVHANRPLTLEPIVWMTIQKFFHPKSTKTRTTWCGIMIHWVDHVAKLPKNVCARPIRIVLSRWTHVKLNAYRKWLKPKQKVNILQTKYSCSNGFSSIQIPKL